MLAEYFGYLRRNPEPEGYAFWLNVLNHGDVGNYRGMVCSFITSVRTACGSGRLILPITQIRGLRSTTRYRRWY